MKIQEVRELIKLIDQSTIDEFEYEHDGAKITLKKRENLGLQAISTPVHHEEKAIFSKPAEVETKVAEQPASEENKVTEKHSPEQDEDEGLHKIESPMVGTFYSSPSPEDDVYVKSGDKVNSDTVVCIVEAMKLFNEIEADVTGEIVKVLVENGELVEYGQPLFLVKSE